MRNKPIEVSPWEVEAARRREVIEADFGAPHQSLPEVTNGVHTTVLAGPLAALIAGITRSMRVSQPEGAECLPHRQPGLGTSKPGA